MRMVEHLEELGTLFFRRRGSLPSIIMLPVLILSLADYRNPFGSAALDLMWELFCFLIAMSGVALRVIVSGTVPEGTSGRNTEQRADELNTTGIYSIVRHPLYVGNFLIALGVAMQPRVWYVPVIAALVFALYYERIIVAEEAYLDRKFGEQFRVWAAAVPIALPRWRAYHPSRLTFSWRAALRREFYGVCAIITAFFVLDLLEDMIEYHRLRFDFFWAPLFVLALAGFFTLRALKHKTEWLRRY
jgi:protein-S-isoprenylcysteine O-methyltransferase Ste14